jgi:hypothetical protein
MYLVFPIVGFLFIAFNRTWTIPKYVIFLIVGIFGLISLAALALMFTGGYDVVIASATSTGASETTSTPYDVQSSDNNLLINAVSRSIMAEYPSTTSSQLQGDEFNCMSVYLSKSGSPPVSEPVIFGVFDGSGNTIKQFGQLNVTEIGLAFNWYEGCLPGTETWTVNASNGERIGVMYDAGDASNSIHGRRDTTNPYDGTITFIANFIAGSWSTFSTSNDMTMVLSMEGAVETSTQTTTILDSQQTIWGWIFAALAVIWGLLYLYVSLLPFMGGLG